VTQPMPDFEAAGLLEGVEGEAREGRRELLEFLYSEGVTIEELARAVRESRLALLPAERVLAYDAKFTIEQAAERAGVPLDFLVRQRRAAGLSIPPPDEPAFSDEDVNALRLLAEALEAGIPMDALVEAARVFGEAAARAAGASRSLVVDAFIRPGDTEREIGFRLAEAARRLYPHTAPTLQYLYGSHLREQIRSDVVESVALAAGRMPGTRTVTVCFADLVGFTKLGQELAPEELGSLATRLSTLASAVVKSPASLVKTIGDAAMLVSTDPDALLETTLDLLDVAQAEGRDFPALRAGVAIGEALNRWGDWYGAPVNVASRVTGVARPGSVLTTAEVRQAVGDSYAWSYAGRRRLKGLRNEIGLYRCRRRPGGGAVSAS
jgi:adenylate cyclase